MRARLIAASAAASLLPIAGLLALTQHSSAAEQTAYVLGGPPEAEAPEIAPTTTTTTEASVEAVAPRTQRSVMSLAEAKEKGLWGRPAFAGCTSKYGSQSPPEVNAAIASSSWPQAQWDKVCRVAGCESNFHYDEIGRNGRFRYYGMLQAQETWRQRWQALGLTDDDMLTPAGNLKFARWLFLTTNAEHGTTEQWLPSSKGGWDCYAA